jgi:type IV secretory pathway TrbD component
MPGLLVSFAIMIVREWVLVAPCSGLALWALLHLARRVISTETPSLALPAGRIPRIANLMALAHHFERLVVTGVVKDNAE